MSHKSNNCNYPKEPCNCTSKCSKCGTPEFDINLNNGICKSCGKMCELQTDVFDDKICLYCPIEGACKIQKENIK